MCLGAGKGYRSKVWRLVSHEGDHEDGDASYRDQVEGNTQETLDPDPITKSRTNAASSTKRTTRTAVDSVRISKSAARSTRKTPKVKKEPYTTAAGSKVNQRPTLPFAGDAFLIALSLSDSVMQRTSDSKYGTIKKRLEESITRHGGVCIEDWDDLLQLEGTVNERRWVWEKSEDKIYSKMQAGRGPTRKKSNIDRVWVLADEPNKNKKYFKALALGVPCVRSKWVEDGVCEAYYSPEELLMTFAHRLNTLGPRICYQPVILLFSVKSVFRSSTTTTQTVLVRSNNSSMTLEVFANPLRGKVFSSLVRRRGRKYVHFYDTIFGTF